MSSWKRVKPFLLALAIIAAGTAAALAQPAIWEPNYGVSLGLTDDSTYEGPFGTFSFPFAGTTYTGADQFSVSSNGFISLGGSNGDDCCSGNPAILVGDTYPRIAVFWADLNPNTGAVYLNFFDNEPDGIMDRMVVTWDTILYDNNQPITVQAQLYTDGTIVMGYSARLLSGFNDNTVVGVSPAGGAPQPASTDLNASLPIDTGTEPTAYELWVGDPPPIDIALSNIVFIPNGTGGWIIDNTVAAPVPALPDYAKAVLALVLVVGGLVFSRFRP